MLEHCFELITQSYSKMFFSQPDSVTVISRSIIMYIANHIKGNYYVQCTYQIIARLMIMYNLHIKS